MHKRTIGRSNSWLNIERDQIIVAHFDHGIRSDSPDDETFVRQLASSYGCEYRSKRIELGADASEDTARRHRYAFLAEVCVEFDALLVTAHHMNDIAETIAINLTRGTGWRGLAAMDLASVYRPLQEVTKQEILQYAAAHDCVWHEDSTNTSQIYLRNRLRTKLQNTDLILQLAALRSRQIELKQIIDSEALQLVGAAPYSRYFLAHCGDGVAIELLRMIFMQESGASPTIPARERALHAVKVARHGSVADIASGIRIRFTRTHFIVEQRDKVLS